VSFDVFLQSFGPTSAEQSAAVRAFLDPLLDDRRHRVLTPDGDMAVYGLDDEPLDGLMFARITGELAWDVVVHAARVGGWVVVVPGAPCVLVEPGQVDSVPADVVRTLGVVTARSGQELRAFLAAR